MATKTILFMAFFSIGLAAVAVAFLTKDFNEYYTIKLQLYEIEQANKKLEKLIDNHTAMINYLKSNPTAAQRLAPYTLGLEPNLPETVIPKSGDLEIVTAKKAVKEALGEEIQKPVVPNWLVRCSNPLLRRILFGAGAALIIISFMCFGRRKEHPQQ